MTPRQEEYVEEVEFLRSCGISDPQILVKLNVTASALYRGLYRAGRPDLARAFGPLQKRQYPRRDRRTGVCPECRGQCNYRSRICRDCRRGRAS